MHKLTAIQIGVLVFAICYSAMMVSEGQTTVSNPATTGNNPTGNSTTDAPTSGNNTTGNSATDAPTSSNNSTSNSTTDAPTSGNSTTGNNTTGNPTTNKPTSGNNPVTSPGSSTGAATTTNSAPSRPLPAGTFSSLLAAILAATLLFHLSW
ncbi:uncharacterized protein LOC128768556 [Synchiropus splendidus]|uniref:uncharacterized protein LOC128768556 n=1 Tax=Synchiropus splendidus TaxID=270530 RepID=UPI00237E715B|nr:uncharacterized protein LOC128768556 [Synchiropus splendidus]